MYIQYAVLGQVKVQPGIPQVCIRGKYLICGIYLHDIYYIICYPPFYCIFCFNALFFLLFTSLLFQQINFVQVCFDTAATVCHGHLFCFGLFQLFTMGAANKIRSYIFVRMLCGLMGKFIIPVLWVSTELNWLQVVAYGVLDFLVSWDYQGLFYMCSSRLNNCQMFNFQLKIYQVFIWEMYSYEQAQQNCIYQRNTVVQLCEVEAKMNHIFLINYQIFQNNPKVKSNMYCFLCKVVHYTIIVANDAFLLCVQYLSIRMLITLRNVVYSLSSTSSQKWYEGI
eukprot:TRINITY_DN7089_c0_g2_i8.p1 TRINITY_DN7089_c0_g2~~TRINITY_DN7089_c0_g2_i8.p1  ORF type:complete len:281 (+),score=-12.70 TRINITY_DN7089_c0_g2_i8:1748-2590(+)